LVRLRRRAQSLDKRHFDEEYFDNFEVELDVEEEGFRVLSTKKTIEEVSNSDHQISLREVQEVAAEAQLGDCCFRRDARPTRVWSHDANQAGVGAKLRDQQRQMIQEEFQDLEGTVLQARYCGLKGNRCSWQPAASAGGSRITQGNSCPTITIERMRRSRFISKVCQGQQRGPQLVVSRADAGLVVYLFANEVPEIEDEIRIVAVAREANPPSRFVGPRTKIAVDTLDRDVDPVGACIGARIADSSGGE